VEALRPVLSCPMAGSAVRPMEPVRYL